MEIIKIEVDKLPTSCFRDDWLGDCKFLKRYEKQPFYRCSLTNKAATGTKRNRFCPLVERPQSEWIDEGHYADYHSEHAYMCANCGWHIIKSPDLIFENRFCKHCGAEMKGGAELYREETCKSKDRCDDYKYWHCAGCNGCKKGGAKNDA